MKEKVERSEFDRKKQEYFTRLGLRMRKALKLHKKSGLWDRKDGKRDWGNVTEHCLVEAARVEVFADMLWLSEDVKQDLIVAAALHDVSKKEEILGVNEAVKRGVPFVEALYAVEGSGKDEKLRKAGFNERVIRLVGASGGLPETQLEARRIVDKEDYLSFSDDELAFLVMFYTDAYTRDANWVEPRDENDGNELDRRILKNEKYRERELAVIAERVPDEPMFQSKTLSDAMGELGHWIEEALVGATRLYMDIHPLSLPEIVDDEISTKINDFLPLDRDLFDYDWVLSELEQFLPLVGEHVLELRSLAEGFLGFARMKEDGTLVTEADLISEQMIRDWILERFPEHTIRGEEMSRKAGSNYEWIIDPIDGTHPFKHFGNKFGISVGLVKDNESKVGVIYFPAEDILLGATQGLMVGYGLGDSQIYGHGFMPFSNNAKDHRIRMIIDYGEPWEKYPKYAVMGKRLSKLLPYARKEEFDIRSFTFAFLHFITNNIGAMFHCGATPYDIAAACCIANELGFSVSGFDGEPIDFSKEIIPIVISKNKELHDGIMEILSS